MKDRNYIKFGILILVAFSSFDGVGQDMFRVGVGFSLKDSTSFVNTFTFDFNRTENVKEKSGKSLLYNPKNIYLTPSVDVNLGTGTTSSENNILAQLSFGKAHFGDLVNWNLNQRQLITAFEFSPSYHADKSFKEALYYGQVSYKFNFVGSKFSGNDPDSDFVKRGYLIAVSPLVNIGSRSSDAFESNRFYLAAGIDYEMKFRFLTQNKKNENVENWVLKFSTTGFWLISEAKEIYEEEFAGKIKVSIDKRILDKLSANISYKVGNDGPIYKDFHALELGFKFKY